MKLKNPSKHGFNPSSLFFTKFNKCSNLLGLNGRHCISLCKEFTYTIYATIPVNKQYNHPTVTITFIYMEAVCH